MDNPPQPAPYTGLVGDITLLRHELYTPASHIVGYTELLLESGLGGEIAADLGKIHTAATRLIDLIDSVLDAWALRDDRTDVAAIRHELRTPLNQIIGYGELLEEECQDAGREDLVPDLRRIIGAARELFDLINARFDGTTSPVAVPGFSRPSPDPSPSPPLTGRLLVVDDNEMNSDMLARRLEHEGHRVTGVAGGHEALDLLSREHYDLVLLDIMMPEMDGYEVLTRLKADPQLRDTPVIMLSALDDLRGIARCIELGAEDYLPKPFDPVLLRARIGASLEKKRLRDLEVEYLRQVEAVTTAAAAVERGDFDPSTLDTAAERDDALGHLARVFRRMGAEVRAREERLRREVEGLRIEIDSARQARQVAEITETDFFQDLEARARQLRNRRR